MIQAMLAPNLLKLCQAYYRAIRNSPAANGVGLLTEILPYVIQLLFFHSVYRVISQTNYPTQHYIGSGLILQGEKDVQWIGLVFYNQLR